MERSCIGCGAFTQDPNGVCGCYESRRLTAPDAAQSSRSPAALPPLPERPAPSRLGPCADCAQPVSKRAKVCPHCGGPQPASVNLAWEVAKAIFWLLILVQWGAVMFGRR